MTLDPHVFYLRQRRVLHLAWAGGRWGHDDLFTQLPVGQTAPNTLSDNCLAAVAASSNLAPHVFYTAPPKPPEPGNRVEHLVWTGGLWVPQDLFSLLPPRQKQQLQQGRHWPAIPSGVAAMGSGDNFDPHVFYFDESGRVQHLAWASGAWQWQDVFDALPPAQKTHVHPGRLFRIAAMGCGRDRDPRVYYLDDAGRIQELAWSGGHWEWSDLLSRLRRGQPQIPADTLSQLAVTGFGDNLDPHIFYVDADATGNVQHLAWMGDHWQLGIPDVTHAVTNRHAPRAMRIVAAMASGKKADNLHVFYPDHPNMRMQHLKFVNGHWSIEDPGAAGPPQAPQVTAAGWLAVMGANEDRDPRVFYLDDGGDVWQLAWVGYTPSPEGDDFWAAPTNLTAEAGAPKADNTPVVTMGSGG